MQGAFPAALGVSAPSAFTATESGADVWPSNGLADGPDAGQLADGLGGHAVERLARARIGVQPGEPFTLLRAPLAAWSPLWLADHPDLAQAWGQDRTCWLLAELRLKTEPASSRSVPSLAALEAWAGRNGVRLMRRLDVLQPLLAYRAALLPSLPEPARQELRDREAALRTGAHAALLIELGQGVAPSLRPVQVGSGRATEMRALFAEIFGHPMSEAHWRWKYATGLGHAVGLLDAEGCLVAHYGGLSRPARVFGERVMACQVCDVMVSPRARRSLARRGPMFNLAASFLEEQIGWGLRHEIGFGFPSARHHGAADRLGLYEAVDRVVELCWPARGHSVNAHVRPVALQNRRLTTKAVARIESLWREMAKDMGESTLGERDAAWVQWRYLDRPEVEYELHWVLSPWFFRPLGLLVLRRREDALELMDVIAPRPAFGHLVQAARRLAHAAGLPVVRMWITASHRELFAMADPQSPANERELNIDVPACAHTLGPEPARFRGRWFLMAGDADFT